MERTKHPVKCEQKVLHVLIEKRSLQVGSIERGYPEALVLVNTIRGRTRQQGCRMVMLCEAFECERTHHYDTLQTQKGFTFV